MGAPESRSVRESTAASAAGILVVSDNEELVERFSALVRAEYPELRDRIEFVCSPTSTFRTAIDLRKDWTALTGRYGLVISLHCKQVFPAEMVETLRCVNVHPGLNPWNRGWYPHVFSIVNSLPAGATIHEMDGQLDHGGIIAQMEVAVHDHDTSLELYERVVDAEMELLRVHLPSIVSGTYEVRIPVSEGNLNSRRDFEALCVIDREEVGTFGSFIDRVRALTHGEFRNAYFVDDSGRRVFIRCTLERE